VANAAKRAIIQKISKEEHPMAKKAVEMSARPLSPWSVAVMLRGTGIVIRPCEEKSQCDHEVKQIATVLQRELGPSAPARMIQESAESYYSVFRAVSASQDRPLATKPVKG